MRPEEQDIHTVLSISLEELPEQLSELSEAIGESDEAQQQYTEVLQKNDFALVKQLVARFRETTFAGGSDNLSPFLQLMYMCGSVMSGAFLVLMEEGAVAHSLALLSSVDNPELQQFLLTFIRMVVGSQGKAAIPYHCVESLRQALPFLLELVEASDETTAQLAVGLVISLHSDCGDQLNTAVPDLLATHQSAAQFGTELVKALNRADGPKQASQCLQFVGDIFSDPQLQHLFFSSDLEVMIDVILRDLDTEFEEDKEEYYMYMMAIYGLLKKAETHYRLPEIKRLLNNIATGKLADSRSGLLAGNILLDCAEQLAGN